MRLHRAGHAAPYTSAKADAGCDCTVLTPLKDFWVSVAECEQRLTLLRNGVDVCAVKPDVFVWNPHNNTVMIGTC